MKRYLPIQLALAMAVNLMQAHAAAGIKMNQSQALVLSRTRIFEFWGRQLHKSANTRNQRKGREGRRRAWAAGDKRAFA